MLDIGLLHDVHTLIMPTLKTHSVILRCFLKGNNWGKPPIKHNINKYSMSIGFKRKHLSRKRHKVGGISAGVKLT